MGSSQAAQLSFTCCKCDSGCIRERAPWCWNTSTDRCQEDYGRPFKRRATPDPIPSQAGSGQNARTAKRLRCSAHQASERSGGGTRRRRNTDGIDTGTIPVQQPQHSNEPWNVGSTQPASSAVSRTGDEANPGAQADIDAEGDESHMLRLVNPVSFMYTLMSAH